MPTISIFFGVVVQMYWREHPPAACARLLSGIRSADFTLGRSNHRWPLAVARGASGRRLDRGTSTGIDGELGAERLGQPMQAVPGADQE